MATTNQKIKISAFSTLLALVINTRPIYGFVEKLSGEEDGCSSAVTYLVSSLIFVLLTYLSMTNKNTDPMVKWKHSVYSGLIFFLAFSPTVSRIAGTRENGPFGCFGLRGLILHGIIYFGILLGVMYFPERNQ